MYLRLEAARLLIYQAAWLAQQGKPALAEAAAAKLFTSEAWVQSSLDAIQIHGAYGYMKEAGIERDLRDAVAGTITREPRKSSGSSCPGCWVYEPALGAAGYAGGRSVEAVINDDISQELVQDGVLLRSTAG